MRIYRVCYPRGRIQGYFGGVSAQNRGNGAKEERHN